MESVFLVCFLVGLGLTAVSFLLGATHGAGDGGSPDIGHGVHLGHGGEGQQAVAHAGLRGLRLGFLNTMAVTAFLTWFGGVGYILTRFPAVVAPLAVVGAVAGGVAGAAGINYVLHNVLARGEAPLPDADEHSLPGTAARVTSAIYPGTAGEITLAFAGTTRTYSARGYSGLAIPRDTEVVVLKVERGVAFVDTWERALDEPNAARAHALPPPAATSASERPAEPL